MFLLDTDHVSILERTESGPGLRLSQRLNALPSSDWGTTIISYEEQTRGWLARLSQARTMVQKVAAYRKLGEQLETYCDLIVMEFDDLAAVEFQRIRKTCPRVGTADLRIAAIVLANKATLLTRNRADFAQVPGLQIEDWTT